MKISVYLAFCLFLILLLATLAPGQESRGAIVGQVSDATGAAVPEATVVITNTATGQAIKLAANESGSYVAALLLPGSYQVEAAHPGFKRFVRRGIELRVNDRLQVDITLEVGDVAQSVTVSEGAPLLEAADASLGQVVDSKRVSDLPLAHGNPYALIALAPGTSFDGDPKLNRPSEPTHIVGYAMAGTRNGTNDVTLDGVANTAVTGKSSSSNGNIVTASYVPPSDAVAEFKVQTAAFDAKMGQTPGGLVNISLKSGTNKLHGTAYYSKMFPDMMANDFFANAAGQARPDFTYNRWGGSLNGPLWLPKLYDGHDRTFFMWAYEGISESRPRGPSNPITVPTEAERKGDFSELLALGSKYQIYNPFTRRTASGGRVQADPFSGNIIPPALINPVAVKVLAYLPLPLTAGTTADHLNNFPAPNQPENIDYWTHVWRVDHNLNARNRFFVRANIYSRSSTSNDWFKSYASGQAQDFLSRGASFDDVQTFSSTFIGNFRYGYNRYVRLTAPQRGRGFDLTALDFPASLNSAIDPAVREFPFFNIRSGGSSVLSSGNIGEDRNIDTHSWVAAFTKTKGAHTMEFGHEFRAYRYNRYVLTTTASGSYDFDETYTKGPLDNASASPFGQGFASFLLGLPDTRSNIVRNTSYAEQSTAWMFYFQDNWRWSRKLNVTLGFRYELEGPMTERYNRSVRGFDFNAVLPQDAAARAAYTTIYAATPTPELPPGQFKIQGGLQYAGVNGQPRTLWDRLTGNIMPRMGLAYSWSDKTIVRAGFGVFFSPLGIRRSDVIQDGFSQTTPLVPTDDNLTFKSTLSNPFPNGILAPTGSSAGILTDVGTNTSFFKTRPSAPYMQRWQLSVQRELPGHTFLEVAYVGNRGTRLETETVTGTGTVPTRDINALPDVYLSASPVRDAANIQNSSYFSANVPNPFLGLAGMGTLTTAKTVQRNTLLRPFPQFVQALTTDNNGYSWYHALEARIERRLKSGLTLNFAYTWSKFMEAVGYLNAGDPAPSRTPAAQDHTHRAAVSWIYQLPFGRGKKFLPGLHGLADAIVGGWQLQGIYIYQTGAPLSWTDTTMLTDGKNAARNNRNPGQWFDTTPFLTDSTLRPQNHFRTWPQRFSTLRADATNNWDLSAIKSWRVTERVSFQVRGEFLNAFNHTRFAAPTMDPYNRSFGQVTSTAAYPRQIQFGMKMMF